MSSQNPSSIPEFFVEGGPGQLDQGATIDVVPDYVLLEMFNFYLDLDQWDLDVDHCGLDAWQKLVHVCRRWRQLVFASPRRLNLRLFCSDRRPVFKLLDIWPALPIVIECDDQMTGLSGISNIEAAFERNDRVCEIFVRFCTSRFLSSMMVPFPALTLLDISDFDATVLPDSFLGGSAPHLQTLTLSGIALPGLPNLLLNAHHLVNLFLSNIPDFRYASLDATATAITFLTKLEQLALEFEAVPSRSHQTNQHRPPLTRTVLPSLTYILFVGVCEDLEAIVARIDVPLLNYIHIIFFDQQIFDTPQLRSFISRAEPFKALHRAQVAFTNYSAFVTLLREGRAHNGTIQLGIVCNPLGLQLSSMVRVCNSTLPPLPTLEHLSICQYRTESDWQDGMEDTTQWLELFRHFITVKSLYIDMYIVPGIAPALQELAERVTEVLPVLQNVFIPGPVQPTIEPFIAVRQFLGHPVAVQDWERESWR